MMYSERNYCVNYDEKEVEKQEKISTVTLLSFKSSFFLIGYVKKNDRWASLLRLKKYNSSSIETKD